MDTCPTASAARGRVVRPISDRYALIEIAGKSIFISRHIVPCQLVLVECLAAVVVDASAGDVAIFDANMDFSFVHRTKAHLHVKEHLADWHAQHAGEPISEQRQFAPQPGTPFDSHQIKLVIDDLPSALIPPPTRGRALETCSFPFTAGHGGDGRQSFPSAPPSGLLFLD